MPRRPNESLREYKERVLDPISPTFCASKWYDAVIFLNEGRTKSCHHTPDHSINQVEIKFDPSALHNTTEKKEQRAKMLAGERPQECRYCWNIEDAIHASGATDTCADRIPYTGRFSDADITKAASEESGWNSPLRTLEVSFDRTCNFACSYCSPRFSTTWGKDIKKHGGYILQEHSEYYGQDGSELAEPYGKYNKDNPYLEAFWKWWPELSQTLSQFRITGGEPTMSASFWKLADMIKKDGVREDMLISVNSNLGSKESLIDDFIEFTHTVPRFSLFTSCEAHGAQAEYLRDGLDYEYWFRNLRRMMEEGSVEQVTIMTTITAPALFSFTDFLDDILAFREEDDHKLLVSFSMLKAPTFMSVLMLPDELRENRAAVLEEWEAKNTKRLFAYERNGIGKVIAYLRKGKDPVWSENSQMRMRNEVDFYLFYLQHDERRGKCFRDTFPPKLVEWYDGLAVQHKKNIEKYFQFRARGKIK